MTSHPCTINLSSKGPAARCWVAGQGAVAEEWPRDVGAPGIVDSDISGLMAAQVDRRWAVLNRSWLYGVCMEQGGRTMGF